MHQEIVRELYLSIGIRAKSIARPTFSCVGRICRSGHLKVYRPVGAMGSAGFSIIIYWLMLLAS